MSTKIRTIDSQIVQNQSNQESVMNMVYSQKETFKGAETLEFINNHKKKQPPKGWVGGDMHCGQILE